MYVWDNTQSHYLKSYTKGYTQKHYTEIKMNSPNCASNPKNDIKIKNRENKLKN